MHSYEYPRPALTVDCVVFGLDENDLKVLLIERGIEPFAGKWALPGGFVTPEESLEDANAKLAEAIEAGKSSEIGPLSEKIGKIQIEIQKAFEEIEPVEMELVEFEQKFEKELTELS